MEAAHQQHLITRSYSRCMSASYRTATSIFSGFVEAHERRDEASSIPSYQQPQSKDENPSLDIRSLILELHPLQPRTPRPAYRNRFETIPRMLPTSLPSSSLISSFQLSSLEQSNHINPQYFDIKPCISHPTSTCPKLHLSKFTDQHAQLPRIKVNPMTPRPSIIELSVLFQHFLCLGRTPPHHLSRILFPLTHPCPKPPIHNLQTQSIQPQHFHPQKIPAANGD